MRVLKVKESISTILSIVSLDSERKTLHFSLVVGIYAIFSTIIVLNIIAHEPSKYPESLLSAFTFPLFPEVIIIWIIWGITSTFLSDRDFKEYMLSLPISRLAYITSMYVYIALIIGLFIVLTPIGVGFLCSIGSLNDIGGVLAVATLMVLLKSVLATSIITIIGVLIKISSSLILVILLGYLFAPLALTITGLHNYLPLIDPKLAIGLYIGRILEYEYFINFLSEVSTEQVFVISIASTILTIILTITAFIIFVKKFEVK